MYLQWEWAGPGPRARQACRSLGGEVAFDDDDDDGILLRGALGVRQARDEVGP